MKTKLILTAVTLALIVSTSVPVVAGWEKSGPAIFPPPPTIIESPKINLLSSKPGLSLTPAQQAAADAAAEALGGEQHE